MKTILNSTLGFTFIACLLIACEQDEIRPQSLEEEMDRMVMPYLLSGDRVGVAIGVYDNGSTSFKSYGVKSLSSGEQIDEHTLFEIGSITKTFTSTALAKLHNDGEVDMFDEIQQYLKGTIPTYDDQPITLWHLANHTSALPREPTNLKEGDDAFGNYLISDFYSFIEGYELTRPIGSKSEYSNLGMGLLGYILKEQRRTSYYALIAQEILSELGMNNTTLHLADGKEYNIAKGHVGNKEEGEMMFSEVFEGAGVLCSNVSDMLRFLEAQLTPDGSDLSRAIQLTHQETMVIRGQAAIGLGWFLTELDDGQQVIWHNGATLAYSSFIGFNKSNRKGVVILMNSRNMSYSGEIDLGFEFLKTMYKY